MRLENLAKIKAKRVLGLDASTNSLGFARFNMGQPEICGEIFFTGASVFERLLDAKRKVKVLAEAGILTGDYIAIESAIMVKNVQTAIDLAYVYGAIMGELMIINPVVEKVAPISWQSGIGNPALKVHEKEEIKTNFPNKSKTWYQQKGREIRKARTLDIARNYFDIEDGSDNVGDAVGLALHVSKTRVLTGANA